MAEENSVNNETHDLSSLFSSETRDFLVRNNGDQVKINALSGKTVGLYFSASWCPPCRGFTPKLVEAYNELSSKGEFEVVFVSADQDEESCNGYFSKMPWLAIPFSDKDILDEKFEVNGIPHLVILNGEGKVVTDEGVELVMAHGAKAYPFTPERINELKEQEQANQTLESLLVSGTLDYVISSDGSKVPVSELVGKHVLIYFSAHWCPPCRGFTPKLVTTYHEMKAKGNPVEVIFASSDRDQSSFDEYYSEMPWLALPLGDERKALLSQKFQVRGIPTLVAIGPEGRTITTETRRLIEDHGANAFPFTEDHIKDLKNKLATKEGYICEGDVCRKI